MDVVIVLDTKNEPTGYFCYGCLQLWLSLIKDKTRCDNCGSNDIVVGKISELDKQKLIDTRG